MKMHAASLHVRVPLALRQALEYESAVQHTPVAHVVRMAIRAFLARDED